MPPSNPKQMPHPNHAHGLQGPLLDAERSRAQGRILVVTYHFAPSSAIGAVRWTALTRELAARGWELQVLTAQGQPHTSVPGLVKVHCALPGASIVRRWIGCLRVLFARKPPPGPEHPPKGADTGAIGPTVHRRRLRRELSAITAVPDSERTWIRPALQTATKLVRDWRPDLVVSSGPPHSAHVIGRLLSQWFRLAWVADLRDPVMFVPDEDSWVGRITSRRLEHTIVRHASHVITTSPTLTADYRERHKARNVVTIPNGVVLDELPATEDRYPGLAPCHVGSVYANRDPLPLVNAFGRALIEQPHLRSEESALRFAGHVSPEVRSRVLERMRDLGAGGATEFLGVLPKKSALRLVANSTLAVVLAQDQHHSIPGKLYESIAMGVPTLVLTERGSATWEMARSLGAWAVEPEDEVGVTQALLRASEESSTLRPKPVREELGYRVRAAEVDAVLRRVLEELNR